MKWSKERGAGKKKKKMRNMKRDGQGISEVGRIVPETIQKVTF